MRYLTIATRNANKTRELCAILGPEWIVEDLTARPDLPEPEETGATFEENAIIKAVAASSALPGLVIADDSGLEVDLLNGAPGVYSARYAGAKATDQQNRDHLLTELARLNHAAEEPVIARFRCVIAVAENGKTIETFSGAVEGRILLAEAGAGGFGYDPLFIPDGRCQTFAELDPATKNSISHRARAMEQFIDWLSRRRGGRKKRGPAGG
jgi:XTP/dITP diphosphohydrolase